MELKDFIRETLVSIDAGLKEASSKTGEEYKYSNNTESGGHIDFEVQVYAENGNSEQTDGKISVGGSWFGVGAKAESGGESNESQKDYEMSTIKFKVVRKAKEDGKGVVVNSRDNTPNGL